jgi:CHAD domain-containing protein
VATPAKSAKLEDKLSLERALRALEDAHQSLKEFSTTDTVTNNDAVAAELKTLRHKAKKLRKAREYFGRPVGPHFQIQ